jgi:hypothetical protein
MEYETLTESEWDEVQAVWDLLEEARYVEVQQRLMHVAVPFFELWAEMEQFTSGDGYLDKLLARMRATGVYDRSIVALTGGSERITEAFDLLGEGHAKRLLITALQRTDERFELTLRLGFARIFG